MGVEGRDEGRLAERVEMNDGGEKWWKGGRGE